MPVKDLGFFQEFPHGNPEGPSLLECLWRGDTSLQTNLVEYLSHGSFLAVTGQVVFDVLSDERVEAGQLAIQTDGLWVWPADLPYYVQSYNIRLPREFIDHARSLNWSPPDLTSEELAFIERSIVSVE